MEDITWTRCGVPDAELLAGMNEQLSADEGAPVATLDEYVARMRRWLEQDRYLAAVARRGDEVLGYVLWREDPDYDSVFVRQFFVCREHRGAGLGRVMFERARAELFPDCALRLDVHDTNPGGLAFWQRMGFVPYSRLMRRPRDNS